MAQNVLELDQLHVSFDTPQGEVAAVRGVSLTVKKGEILCLAGESGCGKTVLCQSVMHLLPRNSVIKSGRILVNGQDITNAGEKEMRSLRKGTMAMIFQDPLTSLNPTIPIGRQITEALHKHQNLSKEAAKARAIELLRMVEIDHPEERFKLQPHFFSGGMRQRCVLAIALAANPQILFADEATTALDVTVEAKILDLLVKIRDKTGIAIVFVSHDLGAIAHIADRVAVMYAGRIAEIGTARDVFYDPKHPYTWGLLSAMPSLAGKGGMLHSIPGMPPSLLIPEKSEGWTPLKGDAFASRNPYALAIDYEKQPPMFQISETHSAATWLLDKRAPKIDRQAAFSSADHGDDRTFYTHGLDHIHDEADIQKAGDSYIIEARHLKQHFKINRYLTIKAVDDVSFGIKDGEIFGLVGETGCGKSTIARSLSGIYRPTDGEIRYRGERVTGKNVSRALTDAMHREIQMIFQDNAAALNPRMTIRQIIEEPVRITGKTSGDTEERLHRLIGDVGLSEDLLGKLPSELSGGQRQRVAIARSLMVDPRLIIADEPVASLDISIQAQIINLFQHLQHQHRFSFLFIAHDLSVVEFISDRVGVMLNGKLVEIGSTEDVFANPQHPYTKALLSAIHVPDPDIEKNKKALTYDRSTPISDQLVQVSDGHFAAL